MKPLADEATGAIARLLLEAGRQAKRGAIIRQALLAAIADGSLWGSTSTLTTVHPLATGWPFDDEGTDSGGD